MYPYPLERICLTFISRNEFVECNINRIKDLPYVLIQRLVVHLSPYGLYILEKKNVFQGASLKEKWLTQWQLAMCCRLDIRKYLEESITWNSHCTLKQFNEQEVFYNSLMKEIIENLQLKKPIEQCYQSALLLYMSYPHSCDSTSNFESITQKYDLKTFLSYLSSHVTLLHVTAFTATRIVEYMDIFQIIIKKITKLNINLLHRPYFNLSSLCLIINLGRKHNLQSIKLAYNTNLNSFDSSCITNIFDSICDNMNYTFSIDDYDKELCCSDDGLSEPSLSYQYACIDDLYDIAVESISKCQSVDTRVIELEVVTNDIEFSDILLTYLPMWTSLESLCIHSLEENVINFFYCIKKSITSLKYLEVIPLEIFPEPNIVDVLYPKCLVHQNNNCHITKFVYRGQLPLPVLENILKTSICKNKKNETDKCQFSGVTSLTTHLGEDFNFAIFFVGNTLLKELTLYQTCSYHYDDNLFEALVDHPSLETFKIESIYKKPPHPIVLSVSSLLFNKTLTQLAIVKCFNSGTLGKALSFAISSSNLVTLIWSDNGLENEGLNEFSNIFLNNGLSKIQNLDLSNNFFDAHGVSLFADSLALGCRYLHKLVINYQCDVKERVEYLIHINKSKESLLKNIQEKFNFHVHTVIGSSGMVADNFDYISEM
ncbi:uncharacterized protein LOC100209032 isoform X3 [Hydra vulgaris]|uniref:Uncharacterized protein LOC100209032 isoform X3 n=1 Tax=Hydra vulgaris TaxID=6087 RepID=A0ABM4C6W8_HYDVU